MTIYNARTVQKHYSCRKSLHGSIYACDPCPQENNLCTMTCSLTVESLNCLHMDLPSQSLHGISRRTLALTAQLCMGRIDITYRSLCYYTMGKFLAEL